MNKPMHAQAIGLYRSREAARPTWRKTSIPRFSACLRTAITSWDRRCGELEIALSSFCGAQHALTCSNGTDALGLILMALELGATDAVLCPSFTFAATAEAVAWFGATPVFVDVDEHTFNMDPASLEAGIGSAKGARPDAGRGDLGRPVRSAG